MKKYASVLVVTIVLLLTVSPGQAASEHLYTEETSAYSRVNGETLRWSEKREFVIDDYTFFQIDGSSKQFVNISMTDDSTNGILHNVVEEVNRVNYDPTIIYNSDGSIFEIKWDVSLFRLAESFANPFPEPEDANVVNYSLGHKDYDEFVTRNYFSVALEYFEFHVIDGEMVKLKVNTEITTDNEADGRVFRSSMNIIKRTPDDEIVFDYNHDIIEVNQVYRLWNLLDQPVLWVPVQIGLVFLVVYIYIRIQRYLQKKGYKIIKEPQEDDNNGEPKE